MSILLLLTDLFDATGGIQTFNRSLVTAVDRIGRERNAGSVVLVLNDQNAAANTNGYFSKRATTYRAFARSKSKFVANAIKEAASATTVVIGHVNFAPLALALRARNSQLRILLTVFGIDAWNRLSRLQLAGLRSVERIVSISSSTRDRMVAANNLNGTRFEILPCALDPHYGQEVRLRSRAELGLPSGKMILSTARLDANERYKGIDDVVLALPKITQKHPDAFYVIVGDGTDRNRLEALARETGVFDAVRFVGRVDNDKLPSFYNASDLFILPSTGEGFGIVFLEAMFYGKCCVGARAAATPEVIDDGVTGVLVEPNQPEQIAETVGELFSEPERMRKLGSAGKKRLEEWFSLEMFTNRLSSILNAE